MQFVFKEINQLSVHNYNKTCKCFKRKMSVKNKETSKEGKRKLLLKLMLTKYIKGFIINVFTAF